MAWYLMKICMYILLMLIKELILMDYKLHKDIKIKNFNNKEYILKKGTILTFIRKKNGFYTFLDHELGFITFHESFLSS